MPDSDLQKAFNAASAWLSSSPAAASLPNDVKLELYGLFKYINTNAGPDSSRPSIFSPAPRAKHDAWAAQYAKYSAEGLAGQQAARQRYIEIAKEIGWSGHVDQGDEDEVDLENLDEPERGERKGKPSADNPIGGVKVSIMSGEDDESGMTSPLHHAVSENDMGEVEKLVKQDPSSVNSRDEYGYTPLHLAADRGHVEMTKLLLQLEADKEAKDEDDQTPLMLAEISGRNEIVEILVK